MKFSIVQEVSPEIINKLGVLNRVADFLEDKLSKRNYGAVEEVIIGINCINPKLSGVTKDFETGLVIYKRYTKAKKFLDFKIKFNYGQTIKASEDVVVDIFEMGLLKSYSEIEALNVKDFDIEGFYDDVKNFLQNRAWLSEPFQEKFFQYQPAQQQKNEFSLDEKMPSNAFWNLIEEARVKSQNRIEKQIEIITVTLSQMGEKEILGFECTLRELLVKASHYNVMAVQKIVEGNVNDDSFLYFRCKLILYGKITFENAINNPNYIFDRIDHLANGEPLLATADRAFGLKYGGITDKIYPREYASEIIDYNSDSYPVLGKDWVESELPKRYSKLWAAYK